MVVDFGKLQPIMDKILYANEGIAKELWNSLTTIMALVTMFQQDGQSDDKKKIIIVDECYICNTNYRILEITYGSYYA